MRLHLIEKLSSPIYLKLTLVINHTELYKSTGLSLFFLLDGAHQFSPFSMLGVGYFCVTSLWSGRFNSMLSEVIVILGHLLPLNSGDRVQMATIDS